MNTCEFSPARKYRYALWRSWGDSSNYVNFIGLNPSIADDFKDDPTIRKCRGFAKRWGYGAMCMTNLFAFRCPHPLLMMREADPIGPDNAKWLISIANNAKLIVAAWGNHGKHLGQDFMVGSAILGAAPMWCLRQNKDGSPAHPLYIPYGTELIEYRTR